MTAASIVTGTGRSGTRAVAELLQACGLDATHEGRFGFGSTLVGHVPAVDCSWIAGLHIAPLRAAGVPMVQVTRHPMDVLRSLVGIGFPNRPRSTHAQYGDIARKVLPVPLQESDDPVAPPLAFVLRWAERLQYLPRLKVESLERPGNVAILLRGLEVDALVWTGEDFLAACAARTIGLRAINHRRRAELQLDNLEHDQRRALVQLCHHWHYDPEAANG